MLRSAPCEPARALGALTRVSPDLVVLLGGLSVTLLAVALQPFLWFESSNDLGLYLLVTVAWTLAQRLILRRKFPTEPSTRQG